MPTTLQSLLCANCVYLYIVCLTWTVHNAYIMLEIADSKFSSAVPGWGPEDKTSLYRKLKPDTLR